MRWHKCVARQMTREFTLKRAISVFLLLAGCFAVSCTPEAMTGADDNRGGGGAGGVTAKTGHLRVSADSPAHLYINNSYYGHGSLYVELNPGSYLVAALAHSDGRRCWEIRSTVYAGQTSTVSNNAWCR